MSLICRYKYIYLAKIYDNIIEEKKKGETNIQIVEVINNGKCFWVEKCSDLLVASPNASFFFVFPFFKKRSSYSTGTEKCLRFTRWTKKIQNILKQLFGSLDWAATHIKHYVMEK